MITEKIYLARSEYYHDHSVMPNLLYIGVNIYIELIKESAPLIMGHMAGMELVYDTNNPDRLEVGYVKKVSLN